jgi:HEAT repeat protein
MEADIQVLFIIVLILICIDVIIICRLIIRKSRNKKVSITSEYYNDTLIKAVLGNETNIKKKIPISHYLKMKQSVHLNEIERERAHRVIDINKVEKLYFKRINSIFRTNRIEAIIYLGTIKTEKARLVLENKLIKEKDITVKLYIAIALNDIFNKESISALISSLQNANRFYRDKVNMLIAEFGEDFNSFLPKIIRTNKIEVKELIVDFASVYFSEMLKKYLVDLIDNKDVEIRRIQRSYEIKSSSKKFFSSKKDVEKYLKLVYKACDILARYYPSELNAKKYLNSKDINIKNMAISALSDVNSKENINKLLLFLKEEDTSRSAINAISKIIERNPDYINIVVNTFHKDKNQNVKEKLAKVLSKRIEYFIMNLSGNNKEASAEIIKEILLQGRTSEVIDFLNKNKDKNIEKKFVEIIRGVISKTNKFNEDFSRYLNSEILEKCELFPLKEVKKIKDGKKDRKLIVNVYLVLVISSLIFPSVYLISNISNFNYFSLSQHIKNSVVESNYILYIMFYQLALYILFYWYFLI